MINNNVTITYNFYNILKVDIFNVQGTEKQHFHNLVGMLAKHKKILTGKYYVNV